MTTRPRISATGNWAAGFGAAVLFAVLTAVFLTANIPAPTGFGEGSITASIGYAMFDLLGQAAHDSESFLVVFEIIDVVLVAALVGAVVLARREDGGGAVTDGGED